MKPHQDQGERLADLYFAYQFGQASVREPDASSIESSFEEKFANDPDARAQFDAGRQAEEEERIRLGLTEEGYHQHHAERVRAHRERIRALRLI